VYKFISDLHFYVTGGEDENELILATVLQGFFDAVALLLRLYRPSFASSVFRLVVTAFVSLLGREFSGLFLDGGSFCPIFNVQVIERVF
jgi:hypothetical protein